MVFQNLTRENAIGANCYLLDFGGTRLVLDSGMNPKEEGPMALPDFDRIGFDTLDAIIVSHSHLDHVGGLPVLMREQPDAPVYMTEPAAALADAMLHNSVNVMTSKRSELGIVEYPLFTHRELDRIERSWIHRSVGRPFDVGSGVNVEFFDAGHILGSTGVRFTTDTGNTVFYTGDVNFEDQTMMMGADFPDEPVDTLILETTRGAVDRGPHFARKDEERRFAAAIESAFQRGGSVLIPVFAMGKTQEVLIMLDNFKSQRWIPDSAPVFIGGLSTKMTTIFDRFADSTRRHHPGLRILRDIDIQLSPRRRRRELSYAPGCIYALSSGMMTEKTVSNGFAFQFLDNPKNSLLFVGYAAPDSPGGKIREADHGSPITLDPEMPPIELHSQVEVFDFSGHAPRDDLRAFANRVSPKKILLVHGDRDALEWFESKLNHDLPDTEIIIPEPGKEYPLF